MSQSPMGTKDVVLITHVIGIQRDSLINQLDILTMQNSSNCTLRLAPQKQYPYSKEPSN